MSNSLINNIIDGLEEEGIRLMVLDDRPRYGDTTSWERADREVVREIIAKKIAQYICS
jgi:hypothetical protein